MKKIVATAAAIFFFATALPQTSPDHLDPRVVAVGKELPRGDVVSHDSRDEAIRKGYHASKYLQPLTDWTRTESADAVTYKTRYKIPFGWIDRRQFLYLGKVSASFDVVVNGKKVAYSQTGSTPSEFDVTTASNEGGNDLEIVIYKDPIARKLENSRHAADPQILGEAYVLSQPRMRVRDIFVNTRMEGTEGLLEFGVIMKSHQLNVADYTVYYELISPKGEILSEGHKEAVLDMRREDTVRFFHKIPDIVPWSHEEPRLYTLLVRTQHEGRFKEYVSFQVGFRSLDVRDGLLHLNGTPLRIVVRDFTPTNDAAAMRTAIETLRSEGVNTLRLHGAPPSHEFYDLCDEMGVYVCNQADIDTRLGGTSRKVGGNPSNDPVWRGAYLDRTLNMYHTSKNSPSIVMFSLAENSANGCNLYDSYLALKEIEHYRPIIYTEGGEWNNDRLDFDAMERISFTDDEQWALITAEDVTGGRFRVHNTRHFTPIIGEAAYKIAVGRKVVSRGSVPLKIAPKGVADIVIPIAGVKEGKDFTLRIDVNVERPVNKYVLDESGSRQKVFRNPSAAVAEKDKEVIGSRSFPSGALSGAVR